MWWFRHRKSIFHMVKPLNAGRYVIRRRLIHGFLLGAVLDEVIGVVPGVVDCVVLNVVPGVLLISKDSSPDPDISSNTSFIVLLTETSNSVSKISGSISEKFILTDGSLGLELNFASPNLMIFFKSSENRLPDLISVRGFSRWRTPDFNLSFKKANFR